MLLQMERQTKIQNVSCTLPQLKERGHVEETESTGLKTHKT